MAMITNDWLDAVKPEFSKEYYKDLFCFVKDEYSKCVVYPPADDIFNAFPRSSALPLAAANSAMLSAAFLTICTSMISSGTVG